MMSHVVEMPLQNSIIIITISIIIIIIVIIRAKLFVKRTLLSLYSHCNWTTTGIFLHYDNWLDNREFNPLTPVPPVTARDEA